MSQNNNYEEIESELKKHSIKFEKTKNSIRTKCPSDNNHKNQFPFEFAGPELEGACSNSECHKVADLDKVIDTHSNNRLQKSLLSLNDIFNEEIDTPKWLVDRLIPQTGKTIISGDPGSYKSWITQALSLSITRGNKVFSEFAVDESGSVLVIDEENDLRTIKERMSSFGAEKQDNIDYLNREGIQIDEPDAKNEIKKLVRENNYSAVIMDSLTRLHSKKENSSSEMSSLLGGLKQIEDEHVAVIIIHHHRKSQPGAIKDMSQAIRGSSDLGAAIDSHMAIRKVDDSKVVVEQPKSRSAKPVDPFELEIIEPADAQGNDINGFKYSGNHNSKKQEKVAVKLPEIIKVILQNKEIDVVKTDDVIEELQPEFGKKSIRNGLNEAAKDKGSPVTEVPNSELPNDLDGRSKYYRLTKEQ